MMDINHYVEQLLSNKKFCKSEYKGFLDNTYSIENVCGVIKPDLLYRVICKALKSKIYRMLLSDILTYIDATSMDDTNFQLLFKFPRKYRTTYLSCIAHSDLSFYQMQVLNQHPLNYEAFTWLFDHVCRYDLFTEEDMLQILRKNADVQPAEIERCIATASEQYGDSLKLDVARQWIANEMC